jgi:hypothetical protein
MRKIPNMLINHPEAKIPVSTEPTGRGYGYWDERTGVICIDPNQPIPEQWIILFHELLHVIESSLVQSGIINRRVNHDFITNAAPLLFGTLAMSGLIEGISSQEAKRMVRRWIKEEEDEASAGAAHGHEEGKQ